MQRYGPSAAPCAPPTLKPPASPRRGFLLCPNPIAGALRRDLSGSNGHPCQCASPATLTVAVCGERVSFENEADRRLQFTRDWSHADFFIAPTHMNCDQVLRGRIVNVMDIQQIDMRLLRTFYRPQRRPRFKRRIDR